MGGGEGTVAGGVILTPLEFFGSKFFSLTNYQKLWHNCSLFVNASYDTNGGCGILCKKVSLSNCCCQIETVCFCIEQSLQFRYMLDKKCLPIQDRIYLEAMTKRLFNVY